MYIIHLLKHTRTWFFLKIIFVQTSIYASACVCVCVCVCARVHSVCIYVCLSAHPKVSITNGVMWHDMDLIWLVEQALQPLMAAIVGINSK